MRLIVDAHEDLAWNMLTFGRDPIQPVAETRARESADGGRHPQGEVLLGYPDYVRGGVALVFATLHVMPARHKLHAWETLSYVDAKQAHRLARQQLDAYERLVDDPRQAFQLVESRSALETVLRTWEGDPPAAPRLGLVLLIEGADCIRQPAEVESWVEGGVRIIGPAWAATRYSGGTREPGPLTADGYRLLDRMADLGVMLDLSHMAEQAFFQALDRFPGTLFASHSNPRALLEGSPTPDRHLSDAMIRSLAAHDGVLGIVPYNRFLKGGWLPADGRDSVTIDTVVRHIDHVCQLLGEARHVGLGSDFDGGFGLDQIPAGLDSIADLRFIGEALERSGYQPADVDAILSGNWLRILRQGLPES